MTVPAFDPVRRLLDMVSAAVASGDAGADGFLELCDPDVTVVKIRPAGSEVDFPGTRPFYHGLEGLKCAVGHVMAAWARAEMEIEEVRDLGDGRVLIVGRIVGEHVDAGHLEIEAGCIATLHNGKITTVEVHLDRMAALVAAAAPYPSQPRWARLGSKLQVPASVIGGESDTVKLEVAEGWVLEVPAPADVMPHAAAGTQALVLFHDDGRVAGWYLPDAQVGVDLRESDG